MPDTKELLESLDAEIAALIHRYHTAPATSLSSFQAIKTGNRYQSIDLRGDVLSGFRAADPQIYTGIPLNGLSLVDLGCNTGEKTRYAAKAGAAYAEGIEYEELFVRIGNLVNAYNRHGNVVIRQGDMTVPGLLKRRYDVGASFSSFVYLRDTLPGILSHIDSMFILETHALTEGWLNTYVSAVMQQMPYWCFYGFTDHGSGHEQGRRGLLLFAKTPDFLDRVIQARAGLLPAGNSIVTQLDIENSVLPNSLFGRTPQGRTILFDARERIAAIPPGDRNAVVQALGEVGDALAAVVPPGDRVRFSSDGYWASLFQGARLYHATGVVDGANPFLDYLLRMAGGSEPGMRDILAEVNSAARRAAERLDGFLQAITDRKPRDNLVAFNPVPADLASDSMYNDKAQNFVLDDGSNWYVQAFDGYHRLAACWLTKVQKVGVMFCWTNMSGLATFNFAGMQGENDDATVKGLIDRSVMRFAFPAQQE